MFCCSEAACGAAGRRLRVLTVASSRREQHFAKQLRRPCARRCRAATARSRRGRGRRRRRGERWPSQIEAGVRDSECQQCEFGQQLSRGASPHGGQIRLTLALRLLHRVAGPPLLRALRPARARRCDARALPIAAASARGLGGVVVVHGLVVVVRRTQREYPPSHVRRPPRLRTGRLLAPTRSTPWLAEPPPPSSRSCRARPARRGRSRRSAPHRGPTDWRDHMRPWLPERRAKHGTAARSIPGSGAAPAAAAERLLRAAPPEPPPPDAWRRYILGSCRGANSLDQGRGRARRATPHPPPRRHRSRIHPVRGAKSLVISVVRVAPLLRGALCAIWRTR